MAQSTHSSEIRVTVDNTQVRRALDDLTTQLDGLQNRVNGATAQGIRGVAPTGAPVGGPMGAPVGAPVAPVAPVGAVGAPAGTQARGADDDPLTGSRGAVDAIPVVGKILRSVLGARVRRAQQAMGLEAVTAELLTGGGAEREDPDSARAVGAMFGYTPAESLQMLRGLTRTTRTGLRSAGGAVDMAQVMGAERMGISAQALGAFAGAGALGGGARGTVSTELQRALGLSQYALDRGLSGAGAERFLASIAQYTQRMASEGLSIDTESIGAFAQQVSDSAIQLGEKQVAGEGAMRAVQRVSGISGGALSSFRGQFADLGQGILQAVASRGQTSPLGVIRRLEQFKEEPELALSAMRGAGVSGELIKLALAGAGASRGEIRSLMGVSGTASVQEGLEVKTNTLEETLRLTRTNAQITDELIRMVEGRDPETGRMAGKEASENMMKIAAMFESMALGLTEQGDVLPALIYGIERIPTLLEEIRDVLDSPMSALKNTLKDLF
jgi:hypothetical protein